jgi:putative endonuclease
MDTKYSERKFLAQDFKNILDSPDTICGMQKNTLGHMGESLAENWLRAKGFQVLAHNYRCKHGEIDLIATRANALIFVEVKTRTTSTFGSPQAAITRTKRSHLIKTALHFLSTSTQKPYKAWRHDLIAIILTRNHKLQSLDHIKNILDGY